MSAVQVKVGLFSVWLWQLSRATDIFPSSSSPITPQDCFRSRTT